jgi:hypothetical protein
MQRAYTLLIFGTSEGAGSAASLLGCGVSSKNSFSCFLSVAGALEHEKALEQICRRVELSVYPVLQYNQVDIS